MKRNILVLMLAIIVTIIICQLKQHRPCPFCRPQPARTTVGKYPDAELDFPPAGNGLLFSKLIY